MGMKEAIYACLTDTWQTTREICTTLNPEDAEDRGRRQTTHLYLRQLVKCGLVHTELEWQGTPKGLRQIRLWRRDKVILLSPIKQRIYHELLTQEWQSTRELTLKMDPQAYTPPNAWHWHKRTHKHLEQLARTGLIERQKAVRYTLLVNGARQLRETNVWRRPLE